MKVSFSLITALGLCVSCSAPTPDGKVSNEQNRGIHGTWFFVSTEMDGDTIAGEFLKEMEWTFDKDTLTLTMPPDSGLPPEIAKYVLHSDKNPKWIDITSKGKTRKCIYLREGETLKICGGAVRPGKFSTKAGDGRFLYVLKREKAESPKKPAARKPDAEQIQGTWLITSAVFVGFPAPPDMLRKSKTTYVFGTHTFEMREGQPARTTRKSRYRIDPTRDPRTIDFLRAKKNEVHSVGIYKVEGDTLWLCLAVGKDEKNRPTQFKARIKELVTYVVARRIRPEPAPKHAQ